MGRRNLWITAGLTCVLAAGAAGAQEARPMTFMDVMEMRRPGGMVLSPDGRRVLYTVGIPHWKSGKVHTDLFWADAQTGAFRQLTFTREKGEGSPRWLPDGRRFCFQSDREGSTQVFLMAVDGGEARRLTDAKDGVGAFEVSRDGRWLAFTAGKAEDRQLWILDLQADDAAPMQLTKRGTPVQSFAWTRDGSRIFFLSPDAVDKDDHKRKEKKFDVRIVDEAKPPVHLWSIDPKDKAEVRWTEGSGLTLTAFEVAATGTHVAYRALPTARHSQDVTQPGAQIHLLDLGSKVTRMLAPKMASGFRFSPDGKRLAFSLPDRFESYRNQKLFVAEVAGGSPKGLLASFDGNVGGVSWAEDSETLFFTEGQGLNQHLFQVKVGEDRLTQLTRERGVVGGGYDPEARRFELTFTDPEHPLDLYVATRETVSDRKAWVRLSDANPQVAKLALGRTEALRWKAKDGTTVEGTLVKPLGFEAGKRYPLIVQLHGGPAAADMNAFSGRYVNYSHVYAAGGYLTLQPNYRGSDNYGEAFRRQIGGDFLRLSYGDIMAGVDHLIREGLADPQRLGMMGWSAGGHLSSWTLTQTDRFKAISTGAGTVNWISMYAQSDHQEGREFYLKGRPYAAWDNYVRESAIRYVKGAKTPTLIHVGEKDERVPKPQSDELHMALKKHGVPVEYIVYPGMPHGLTEPRYQLVKMVSEYAWFERWVMGKEGWFTWKALLDTLPEEPGEKGGAKPAPAK